MAGLGLRGIVAGLLVGLFSLQVAVAQDEAGETAAEARLDGLVLTYDLGTLEDPEAILEQLKAVKDALIKTFPPGVQLKLVHETQQRRKTLRSAASDTPVVELETVNRAAFQIGSNDEALAERVAAAVADALPELAPPDRSAASWIGEGSFDRDGGMKVNLTIGEQPRQFVFPADAPAEQIELVLEQWLYEQEPELVHDVTVTVTENGNQREVQLRIESRQPVPGEQMT